MPTSSFINNSVLCYAVTGTPSLGSSPAAVDHPLYFLQFRFRYVLMFGKRGDECRQGSIKPFLYQFIDLKGLRLLFGNDGGNNTVCAFQNAPLTQPLDHCVGSGALPV